MTDGQVGLSVPSTIRERPILFSAPMVRAILADRKSQTRRVVRFKHEPVSVHLDTHLDGRPFVRYTHAPAKSKYQDRVTESGIECPYGAPGDRLWVKEAHYRGPPNFLDELPGASETCKIGPDGSFVTYYAAMDGEGCRAAEDFGLRVRPSMFMHRWASRILLEVTKVTTQRLTDISEDDATAEGSCSRHDFKSVGMDSHRPEICFRGAWDGLNAKRGYGWGENPWVWVLEFRRLMS